MRVTVQIHRGCIAAEAPITKPTEFTLFCTATGTHKEMRKLSAYIHEYVRNIQNGENDEN